MNARTHIARSILFAAIAWAATPAQAAEPAGIVFDCSGAQSPSLQEVGALLGLSPTIGNFGRINAVRSSLTADAYAACRKTGAARVRLVLEEPAQHPWKDIRVAVDHAVD